MKKLLLSILLTNVFIAHGNAQAFAFQMTFSDAVGNADSIVLGYDAAATDSLDAAFGETNIIGTAYATGLDVRAGNVWIQQNFASVTIQSPFESKKQILINACGNSYFSVNLIAEINIVSTHFPITAHWSKELFNDPCRNGSVFTGVHPGGWWDTGGFQAVMAKDDSVILSPNQYYYLNGTDTVFVYWFAFFDSTLLSVGINDITDDQLSFTVFPNPASDVVSIQMNNRFGDVSQIAFYNIYGQKVLTATRPENINIARLTKGLYFIYVTNPQGLTIAAVMQKI